MLPMSIEHGKLPKVVLNIKGDPGEKFGFLEFIDRGTGGGGGARGTFFQRDSGDRGFGRCFVQGKTGIRGDNWGKSWA